MRERTLVEKKLAEASNQLHEVQRRSRVLAGKLEDVQALPAAGGGEDEPALPALALAGADPEREAV